MWTKLAIIAMLIVLFICTVYFSSSKRKEKLFLKYNKSFGKEPQNYNKEANIEFLKDFYKARRTGTVSPGITSGIGRNGFLSTKLPGMIWI